MKEQRQIPDQPHDPGEGIEQVDQVEEGIELQV